MLHKVTVENFKAFKHLELDCAGLNLLVGLNGAGKSSFVQFLRLMSNVSHKIGAPMAEVSCQELGCKSFDEIKYCYSLHNVAFEVVFSEKENGVRHCLSRVIEQSAYLNANSADADIMVSRRDAFKLLENEGERWLEDLTIRESGETVSEKEWEEAKRLDQEESLRIDADRARMVAEDEVLAKAFREMWSCSRFVDAFRIKPTEIHKGGSYNTLAFLFQENPNVVYNPEGQNAVEFIYQSGVAEGNPLLDKVNACLQWVSPGAQLAIRKQEVGDDVYYVASVGYGVNGEGRQFKPQHVGFGVSYILPVLVTLLSARPGNIIIVENPEAHLHPRGQAEIGKLIAETVARGVQVFVETHSDHVINGIRVAVKKGNLKPSDVNIAFFERKPHEVVDDDGKRKEEVYTEVRNIHIDDNGALSEYPADFMDEWNIQQMKLLRRG